MKDALAEAKVTSTQLHILIALLGLAVAPHVSNLSIWVIAFYFFLTGFRMLAVRWPKLLPSRITLFALTILALVIVGFQAGLNEGRQGGVGLLVAMVGLKLLEVKTRRDIYMAVFLGYFVVVTQFLFSQNLLLAVYLSLVVIASTGLLVAMNRANVRAPLAPAFKQAIRLLLAATPAMVVLFVLFPRLGGPLWGIGLSQDGAVTGMTDTLTPGSISHLSQSSATAFRVRFDREPPPPEQRYWRGIVLWQTDGKTWRADDNARGAPIPLLDTQGYPTTYEVTLEASHQPWLYLLDLPQIPPRQSRFSSDLVALARSPVDRRTTYRGEAWPQARLLAITAYQRELGLMLPATVTPRMRELVAGWQARGEDAAEVVNAALRHFREQPFVYTLTPPRLDNNPEDQFLFETKRGFCEHYATSFALLMRIAGIPARLVIGYQGGEYNPLGDHLIVRQSDAHAWTEVYLEDQGWVRVDPTAAVAPERIEHAIRDSASEQGAPVMFDLGETSALGKMLREARWFADSFELGWHRWVVGFSRDRQRGLLQDLGLGGLDGYSQGLLAIGLGALAMAAGALLLRLSGDGEKKPVRDAYRKLQWKLRRAGLHVAPWLGPRDLKNAAITAFPLRANELRGIFDMYISLRYGQRQQEKQAVRRLRWRIRRLRLPRVQHRVLMAATQADRSV